MLRSTYFDNRVKDPVSNVTLDHGRRQRHPAAPEPRQDPHPRAAERMPKCGSARRGALPARYLYEQAKVREFAANPALVGKFLPQVPAHRGSVQVVYGNPTLRSTSRSSSRRSAGSSTTTSTSGRCPASPSPACRATRSRRSPPHAPSAATSRRSSACRTSSTKEYFVGTLPTTDRLAAPGDRRRARAILGARAAVSSSTRRSASKHHRAQDAPRTSGDAWSCQRSNELLIP